MPRTKRQSDPMLPRLLEEMFTASAERKAAVHRKLMSGLHDTDASIPAEAAP